MNELTREIYGNIGAISKVVFYICAFASVAICAWGIWRRRQLWRLGRDSGEKIDWKASFTKLRKKVLTQRSVKHTKRKAGKFHAYLFFGFAVLFIGTCLIAVEDWGHLLFGSGEENLFHKGLYFVIYEIALEIFGVLFVVGCGWFLMRMLRGGGGDTVGYRKADLLLLVSLVLIGVTGFALEGLRIIREATPYPQVSFVGWGFSLLFGAIGMSAENVSGGHFFTWWFHSILVFGFIAALPFTRLLHVVAGTLNLCIVTKKLGHMVPITMEELEETGKTGVEHVNEFTRRQLLSLDACVACGRCTDACPATEAGKPLSPMEIVQDIRGHFNLVAPLLRKSPDGNSDAPRLHGDVISADSLWSCTTCNACYSVCPLGVNPLGFITDMRRFQIGDGALGGPPATALQKVQRSGNPWGMPARERFKWSEGLSVPTVNDNPDFEILYWIGCSASYDRRIQKVAHAVVKLLDIAGVNYATLGPEERCTGEFARRMGDEFLFQEQAATNIATLDQHKVKTIITHCPHCLNSLSKDYPQFGGDYEVVHHSVFLSRLIMDGKLAVDAKAAGLADGSVTYHDPCYLSRVQRTITEPRALIGAAAGNSALTEMPRNGKGTSCCGAGGGRMWFDDGPDERVGRARVAEAIDTGADTIAVSCPFCLTMMSDGAKAQGAKVEVRDVAELLAEAIDDQPASS
jgi:Fe-S oxidoreductase/nitrate reductase gamma subunit